MKLKYGKHAGEDICDVPVDYLIWLEQQDIGQTMRNELNHEIERRTGDRSSKGRDVPKVSHSPKGRMPT